MKITVEVIIRGSKYTIENDGVTEGAKDIKKVIAELENADVETAVQINH